MKYVIDVEERTIQTQFKSSKEEMFIFSALSELVFSANVSLTNGKANEVLSVLRGSIVTLKNLNMDL